MKAKPQKIETATERYLRLQSVDFEAFLNDSFTPEALEGVTLSKVKSPGGMEWELRPLSAEFYGAAGTMPMSLAARMARARNGEPMDRPLTSHEEAQMIEFASKAIRFGCVSPRLVDKPKDEAGPHELSFDLVSMGDYKFLSEYLLGEGKGAARLGSFR